MKTQQSVAIIGGGISGLAAAHRLTELSRAAGVPLRVVLFESSQRPGGVFGTELVDGFRMELGADMFITNKPAGIELCRRLGLDDQLIAPDPAYRRSLILARGRPVETPSSFELMAPARLWPVLKTPLLSPLGKLRVLCEPLVRSRAHLSEDESLADFVRRRLGREAFERIVQPMVGGIYTGDPERLSIEATLPRFREMERTHGSLYLSKRAEQVNQRSVGRTGGARPEGDPEASGVRYGLFVSLQEGMGQLQTALLERLTNVEMRLACRVDSVRRTAEPHSYVVTAADEQGQCREHDFDAVIVATPSRGAAEILEEVDRSLAEELRGIEFASTVVVVNGYRISEVRDPLEAYGLVVPHREGRRILAVSYLSRKFPNRAPAGHVLLRTFIGGALQPEMFDRPDEELHAIVAEELQDILGVTGAPVVSRLVRYPQTMPQYHVGHLQRVARIESLTGRHRSLALCGNSYRGVGIPDCIADAERAAESIWQEIGPVATQAASHSPVV